MWIWRLAEDRWPKVRQRLDFYHTVQYLAAVGRALSGEDKEKFKVWLKPSAKQLKNESAESHPATGRTVDPMPSGPAAQAVAKEVDYFTNIKGESTTEPDGVRAYPLAAVRWKRPGDKLNAGSADGTVLEPGGDEALLCGNVLAQRPAGTCSSPTPLSTLQEIEMRTQQHRD